MGRKCNWCGNESPGYQRFGPVGRSWWTLSDYADHLNGYACPTCFDDLEHRDGVPVHPERYKTAMVRYRLIQTNGMK